VPKDPHHSAATDQVLGHVPEQVTVAVAELASAAREGLLALAVGTGLQVLQAMLADERRPAGRAQGPPQPRPGGGAPRQRAGPGDPWWSPGAGAPGPDRRRHR
jgi:hypothetical protein